MVIKRIDIYERSRAIGAYVVEQKATVRQAAKVYGVSKSTVHKDLNERLPHDSFLYQEVRRVLEINKDERSVRGGQATKQKYLQRKKVTT